MDEFLAYTYCLTHKPSGKRYYGCRRIPHAHPERDLWNIYFSSSPVVKELIIQDGIGSFSAEVRKIFPIRTEALKWEAGVIKRIMRGKNKDLWLNSITRPRKKSRRKSYWKMRNIPIEKKSEKVYKSYYSKSEREFGSLQEWFNCTQEG